jgi:hypothetical protein
VRVTFVRGPRRVVVGADPSSLSCVCGDVHAVRVGVDVPVLLVVSEEEVVDVGVSMSVVTGGLVLVIVAVVVGAEEWLALAENDGSTKFRGACTGSLAWRDTNVTAAMRMPITARPATLAPTTAGVRLYHDADDGVCSSWSSGSRPAMASDSSRGG